MKKYTLLSFLLIGGLFINNVTAQNSAKSTEERQAIQDKTMKAQQLAAVQSEVQSMIFRFESAYEEQDLESTVGLQKTLSMLMQTAIDYQANNGKKMDDTTVQSVEDFSKYTFDFSREESKQDITIKGIPSQFMKMLK